ncbi:MAG: pirin family protein [Chitinophagales bacterium]|nr:pirin family protein [Chitinophagales bacterium]
MDRKLKKLQKARKGIQYIIYPEIRAELSPFVFFDAGNMLRNDEGLFIGTHPHSGIGIITYFEGANLLHDDSAENDHVIADGGVQWIRAGGVVWHQENYAKKAATDSEAWPLTIHQLWMQLPPELEESEVEYQNIQPEDLPVIDNIKIVAGTYNGIQSPLKVPYDMTYLDIKLKAGESFEFQTPKGQTRGFVFPRSGSVSLYEDNLPLKHLSILEDNDGKLEFLAETDSAFILLMAAPQNHPIITQGGSIHTNEGALERSFKRIKKQRRIRL